MPDSLSKLSFWPLCLDARFVKQLFKCTSFTDPRGVLVISIDFVSMINVGAKKAAAMRQLKASKARMANMQSMQARALEQQRVRELRLQQLAASADEEQFEIEDGYVDLFRGKVCCRPLPVSTLHLFQVSLRLSIYHIFIYHLFAMKVWGFNRMFGPCCLEKSAIAERAAGYVAKSKRCMQEAHEAIGC